MRGKTISGSTAVLILAFFFLPWFSVSVDGRMLGQFSGFQLAVGVGRYALEGLNGRSVLFLIPLSAAVILLWVVAPEGDFAGAKFRIAPPIRIGRDPGNDIVIDDNSMSGYHAVVREQGGAFHIQDLNSTNGIYLENQIAHRWQRVPAATLVNDMRIKLGRTIFQVVIEE